MGESSSEHPDGSKTPVLHKQSVSSCSDVFQGDSEVERIENRNVWYLSYKEARSPGFDETIDIANKIYEYHKPYLKTIQKSEINVDMEGIRIKELVPIRRTESCREETSASLSDHEEMTEREVLYKSPRIKYCGVLESRPKVLFFNYQHGARAENVHIHVVVFPNKDAAKSIAKTLNKVFSHLNKISTQKDRDKKREHQNALKNNALTKSSQSLRFAPSLSTACSQSSQCGSGEWISDSETVCLSTIA